ncbi:unnamed protein product [Paramecium sonneborni]|uniref:Uncharacterized protein n=1 Tax=Paramecium sonneborni TaxID=65129 RepID=A0A8S1KNK8_9CILI|nr:unnamed protein product [Paramecium sonneborni]
MKKSNLDCVNQAIHNQIVDASINLSQDKEEMIIKRNKLQKIIKHSGGQTLISYNIVLDSQTKTMNATVYEDLMSFIANYVNQQDMNLLICLSDALSQNKNRLPKYILKYSIIADLGQYKQMFQQIEQILLIIHENIEKICINAYINGDNNLENDLRDLLIQYKEIL